MTGPVAQARRAAALMAGSALLFSLMGALVKAASAHYSAAEIVAYRGLIGALALAALALWQGESLRTPVPGMHLWRSFVGVASLGLWFTAIGGLPLGTAVTLNYMSSVWMAVFILGAALWRRQTGAIDRRVVLAVALGFGGVALVLQPTLEPQQAPHALAGLVSGMGAALAYLQVAALGRAGEPETRVVFYFSLGAVIAGGTVALLTGGLSPHTAQGGSLLLGIGALATLAQWMMTRAYALGQALVNAALSYLGVAFSFVLGLWWFDDPFNGLAVIGMLLIIAAGCAVTLLRARP